MDFSCGKECMLKWNCSWCYNTYCDDICTAYCLEGKPKYWSENDMCKNDVCKERWNALTEKERNKRRKKYLTEPPVPSVFFLCKECKNKYIENNICKGRHKNKIGEKENDFWLRI